MSKSAGVSGTGAGASGTPAADRKNPGNEPKPRTVT
jgi:hypothetical protein